MTRQLLYAGFWCLLVVSCAEKKADKVSEHHQLVPVAAEEVAADSLQSAPGQLLLTVEDEDTLATFPGGIDAMCAHIRKHLRYPEAARAAHVEGRVIVTARVDSRGKVQSCEVMMSDNSLLDDEALRVVKTLPRFTPGKRGGKAVGSHVKVPVMFRLD